jgi:hypothetical protein
MATLKNLSVASLGAVLIALGTTDAVQASQIRYGDSQPLGDGSIRSFITLDDSGNPLDIGLAFNQGALSLPTGDSARDIVTQISLPSEASATAFDHLELSYRPNNYGFFAPVFNVPRFSLAFFQISPEERALICPNPDTTGPLPPTCVGDEQAPVFEPPKPELFPTGLLPDAFPEAGHGLRYFDPDTSFPLTSLYDYAFYNGKVSFMDVLATKAFLESQPNVTLPIKLPAAYSKNGYHPTSYSVTFDAASQEYRMAFTGLTYRSVPEISPTWGLLALGAWGAVSQIKNKLQKQKLASR